VEKYWLPTIRAAVALDSKDPNRAIELLQETTEIELSQATSNFAVWLCPVYLRREAYLKLHDGNQAAAEFQKFIDYRRLVVNFPWGALARLGLARAYAIPGDTAKAKAAYQDFLTWGKIPTPMFPSRRLPKWSMQSYSNSSGTLGSFWITNPSCGIGIQRLVETSDSPVVPAPNTKARNSFSPITRRNSRKANKGMKVQNMTMLRPAKSSKRMSCEALAISAPWMSRLITSSTT
jgi:hypothetical protein